MNQDETTSKYSKQLALSSSTNSSQSTSRLDTSSQNQSSRYELDDLRVSSLASSSPCKPIVVAAMADEDNRFEALFDSQKKNDRSGKFSLQRYSTYTRNQRQRKLNIQKGFKTVVKKLMNKQNWKQRWSKLKNFVKTQRPVGLGGSSSSKNRAK